MKNNFKGSFPRIGDRSKFNRIKRNLYTIIREIQSKFFELTICITHQKKKRTLG